MSCVRVKVFLKINNRAAILQRNRYLFIIKFIGIYDSSDNFSVVLKRNAIHFDPKAKEISSVIPFNLKGKGYVFI